MSQLSPGKLGLLFLSAVFFGLGLFSLVQNSFNGVPHGLEQYGAAVLAIIFGGSVLFSFAQDEQLASS